MVKTTGGAKPAQPSISRFFQKSKSSSTTIASSSQEVSSKTRTIANAPTVELIDSDDEMEITEPNSTSANIHNLELLQDSTFLSDDDEVSIIEEKKDNPVVKQNNPRPKTDFSYTKGVQQEPPTQDQINLRDSLKRKLSQRFSKDDTSELNDLQEYDEDQEDIEEELPKTTKKPKKSKLTPLDQQVKDLKLKHPDKILAVQVGYKYKFYCQDAVVVHKILQIRLVPGKINIDNETPKDLEYNKLAYCSIPEPRLHIHLQRLLDKGLKVGIVQQTETSFINSMENGSSALIQRRITNIFTKATYLEYDPKGGEGIKDDKSMDSLMVIIERPVNTLISNFTVIAIQPLTGEIVYDTFEDNFLRNELSTRLSHLEPIELLYFKDNFTKTTNNVVKHFKQKSSSTSIRTTVFDEEVDFKRFQAKFNEFLDSQLELFNESLTNFLIEQSEDFHVAMIILHDYLDEYGLNSSFAMKDKFITFLQNNHMILTADTLENLEIFQNSFNGSVQGSLMWLLDHTRTKFGYRLLKQWVAKPLIDRDQIEQRFEAVKELSSGFNHFLESFTNVLKNCPDLDKILNRLHYGKIKRKELYMFLTVFSDFEQLVAKFGEQAVLQKLRSELLKEIFESLITLTKEIKPSDYMKVINGHVALDDSFSKAEDHILKYFKLDQLAEISQIDQGELNDVIERIEDVQLEFKDELKSVKVLLKRPALEYVEKNREPYLIEIRQALTKDLPKDWLKINSTKMVARYRTPKMTELYKKSQYLQEIYHKQMNSVFDQFVKLLNDKHYFQINQFIQKLAVFDCLLSLTVTSVKPDHCKPEFIDAKSITLKQARNPIIETLTPNYTANDITMDQSNSCFIVTGPNMGGKSSIVKQIALLTIMAQIGCFIPAKFAKMGIFDSILIRMGSFDNLIKGESTFFVEMSQVLNILNSLNGSRGNALVILDEVGRGTSTVDGIAMAESIVEYILQDPAISQKTLCLFITHFPTICKLADKYPNLANYHMSYMEEKQSGDIPWSKVTFLYQFVKGVAMNSYGLNVAKLASIDDDILNTAYLVSKEREEEVELKRSAKTAERLLAVLGSDGMSSDSIMDKLQDIKFD
ncbi:hypothetical protein WICPIJ_000924 [Wickerhamomyces pijperi]|uniref:DNA mismatch repair protein n=1 Tax=Wickerhamomyces pijperi TaxID=599730 RepID=A0A9P8QBP0_WICPI|nr:hypothetical protein WICPIJ_000924 [Wickerhamomyces pijperi]